MNTMVIAIFAVIMIATPMLGVFLVFDMRRRTTRSLLQIEQRIQTLLKGVYHNTKDIRENGKRFDTLKAQAAADRELQQKALEHQKILLASLSRQSQRVSEMLAGGNHGSLAHSAANWRSKSDPKDNADTESAPASVGDGRQNTITLESLIRQTGLSKTATPNAASAEVSPSEAAPKSPVFAQTTQRAEADRGKDEANMRHGEELIRELFPVERSEAILSQAVERDNDSQGTQARKVANG